MNERLLLVPIWVWIGFFTAGLVFLAVPQVDLLIAGLFYSPEAGFAFRGTPVERTIYHSVEWLTLCGTLAALGLWGYRSLDPRARWRLGGRELVFLLLVLALGPGLIVNAWLKEHWGRARPIQLVEFGGDRSFSPAFIPSDQGGGSFSSGHAAAAFFWVAAALLAKRRKMLWLATALGYGSIVGLARVAAGGHYLSDVVVSFFVVLILALALRQALEEKRQGRRLFRVASARLNRRRGGGLRDVSPVDRRRERRGRSQRRRTARSSSR